MSVTIPPTGEANRLVREIMRVLSQRCPSSECDQFEPHVTVQYVYDVTDVEGVVAAVEPVSRRIGPFEIRFGQVGTFDTVPGLHIALMPSPPLVDLYVRTKRALARRGFRTYAYEAATWRPHLTLSSHAWSHQNVMLVQELLGRQAPAFVADRLGVNLLAAESGGAAWQCVRDLPLTGRATAHAPPARG